MTRLYHALLIGQNERLMQGVPGLLARAGFTVDVLTCTVRFESPHVRHLTKVASPDLVVPTALTFDVNAYDLVVIGDDSTLREILDANVSDAVKLRLLPVREVKNFTHIGRKVGLSDVLSNAGVPTPSYRVLRDGSDFDNWTVDLNEPALLKIDQSGGGGGVFLLDPRRPDFAAYVDSLKQKPLVYPLLAQQLIEGDLLDLSSFYQNGELICTSHSITEAVVNNPFGPSSVRTYNQLSTVPGHVFDILRDLGLALGAHGFVNIACMRESRTGKYYIIEADMRPTVWVDFARYIGDDHALPIARYFNEGSDLGTPYTFNPDFPEQRRIPYVFRLTPWEILTNTHKVWSFCDAYPRRQLIRYFGECLSNTIARAMATHVKPRVRSSHWQAMRRVWHALNG